jgi:HD superfamily phosphohydrolase
LSVVQVVHLAKRFFGSLSQREPSAADTAWVTTVLLPGEQALWASMSVADRRHAVGVGRKVERLLGPDARRPVVAAALLHDVGKVDSNLGTFARAFATVVNRRRGSSRFARYRRHDDIGASMLAAAGSDALTVTWTREHHMPPERWSLPSHLTAALKAADDD